MRLMTIQEAYSKKFERQSNIKQLTYGAGGICAHIGEISPGCTDCFAGNKLKYNFRSGTECNLDCVYCSQQRTGPDYQQLHEELRSFQKASEEPGFDLGSISFSGGGEPLAHLEEIEAAMKTILRTVEATNNKPWFYLYTNGTLADKATLYRLRDLGFDEVRFHLGASNYSKSVLKNIETAATVLKVATVETPAWPLHRAKLFESLPILNDIGVKHLNIGELEINKHNVSSVIRQHQNAEIYQCYEAHLYDEGLVYDVMEEVVAKNYEFSVLDCNCFIKLAQRGKSKFIVHALSTVFQ